MYLVWGKTLYGQAGIWGELSTMKVWTQWLGRNFSFYLPKKEGEGASHPWTLFILKQTIKIGNYFNCNHRILWRVHQCPQNSNQYVKSAVQCTGGFLSTTLFRWWHTIAEQSKHTWIRHLGDLLVVLQWWEVCFLCKTMYWNEKGVSATVVTQLTVRMSKGSLSSCLSRRARLRGRLIPK